MIVNILYSFLLMQYTTIGLRVTTENDTNFISKSNKSLLNAITILAYSSSPIHRKHYSKYLHSQYVTLSPFSIYFLFIK